MKLKELARFVVEKEAKIGQKDGTCLLADFIDDYGVLSEAHRSETEIDDIDVKYWKNAYMNLERVLCLAPAFGIKGRS